MPPASALDQYDNLFSYLAEIANENSIITGDFNVPDINWNTLTAPSHTSSLFCDLVYHLNFTQHIDTATHNILDPILTNIDDDFTMNVTIHDHSNQPIKSDHFLISFEICCNAYSQPTNSTNYIII